jgi:hypothetical protein
MSPDFLYEIGRPVFKVAEPRSSYRTGKNRRKTAGE